MIRYHPYSADPFYQFNPSENSVRKNYYGQPAYPYLFVGGADAGGIHQAWGMYILARMGIESNLEIEINGHYNQGTRETNLQLAVTGTGEITQPNLRLQVVLTESDLDYGGHTHNQVMRDMIPDAEGESFTISNGQTLHFSRSFTVDGLLQDENCEIVVFVQSHTTREILQSAKDSLTTLDPSGVEEDIEALPGSFFLAQNYPNPFNASTIIAFNLPKPAPVVLEIYNLSGQLVRTIAGGGRKAGSNQIAWDGLDEGGEEVSSGVYFCRLEAGEFSGTRRISLIR